MLNNREHHEHRNDLGNNVPPRDAARPPADREVPLPGMAAADDPSMAAIHQWLDGDLAESDARRFDAKQVDMWLNVAVETDRRRRMVTPSHLTASIMKSLPEKAMAPTTSTAASTTVSTVGMPSTIVLAIGASMLALGILIGKMI